MSDTDTTTEHAPAELVEPSGLTALLGGLDMSSMLTGMGIELPSPDDATLDDIAADLADLTARVDWLAALFLDALSKVPAKLRPSTPPAYPPLVED